MDRLGHALGEFPDNLHELILDRLCHFPGHLLGRLLHRLDGRVGGFLRSLLAGFGRRIASRLDNLVHSLRHYFRDGIHNLGKHLADGFRNSLDRRVDGAGDTAHDPLEHAGKSPHGHARRESSNGQPHADSGHELQLARRFDAFVRRVLHGFHHPMLRGIGLLTLGRPNLFQNAVEQHADVLVALQRLFQLVGRGCAGLGQVLGLVALVLSPGSDIFPFFPAYKPVLVIYIAGLPGLIDCFGTVGADKLLVCRNGRK